MIRLQCGDPNLSIDRRLAPDSIYAVKVAIMLLAGRDRLYAGMKLTVIRGDNDSEVKHED
jgi:hypothetical protein